MTEISTQAPPRTLDQKIEARANIPDDTRVRITQIDDTARRYMESRVHGLTPEPGVGTIGTVIDFDAADDSTTWFLTVSGQDDRTASFWVTDVEVATDDPAEGHIRGTIEITDDMRRLQTFPTGATTIRVTDLARTRYTLVLPDEGGWLVRTHYNEAPEELLDERGWWMLTTLIPDDLPAPRVGQDTIEDHVRGTITVTRAERDECDLPAMTTSLRVTDVTHAHLTLTLPDEGGWETGGGWLDEVPECLHGEVGKWWVRTEFVESRLAEQQPEQPEQEYVYAPVREPMADRLGRVEGREPPFPVRVLQALPPHWDTAATHHLNGAVVTLMNVDRRDETMTFRVRNDDGTESWVYAVDPVRPEVAAPRVGQPMTMDEVRALLDSVDDEVRRRHEEALGRVTSLIERTDQIERDIDAERHRWEERRREIERIVSEHANDAEWCAVATRGMEEFGLEREDDSPVEREIYWSATVTISTSITIDDEAVVEEARNTFGINSYDEGFNSIEVPGYVNADVNIEVEVSGSHMHEFERGNTDECICGCIDRETIRNILPTWADGLDFTYDDLTCDNCDN